MKPRQDPTTLRGLIELYETAVRSLRPRLNPESGLQDVLLESRHNAAVRALGPVIDVDAGLAAILPVRSRAAVRETGGAPAAALHRPLTARGVIAAVPPALRLALRGHPAVASITATTTIRRDALDRDGRYSSALVHSIDSQGQRGLHALCEQAADLEHALRSALDLQDAARVCLTDADGLTLGPVQALNHALTLSKRLSAAGEFDRLLQTALPSADDIMTLVRRIDAARAVTAGEEDRDDAFAAVRGVVEAITAARQRLLGRARSMIDTWAREMTLSDARELDKTVGGPFGFVAVHETLGDALLAGALDDCTRADLTDVDLLTVDLTGLRWSVRGTRWPTGTDIVLLITHSRETAEGSGVYVVMSPPTTLWQALLI